MEYRFKQSQSLLKIVVRPNITYTNKSFWYDWDWDLTFLDADLKAQLIDDINPYYAQGYASNTLTIGNQDVLSWLWTLEGMVKYGSFKYPNLDLDQVAILVKQLSKLIDFLNQQKAYYENRFQVKALYRQAWHQFLRVVVITGGTAITIALCSHLVDNPIWLGSSVISFVFTALFYRKILPTFCKISLSWLKNSSVLMQIVHQLSHKLLHRQSVKDVMLVDGKIKYASAMREKRNDNDE